MDADDDDDDVHFAAGVTPVALYQGTRMFLLASEKHGVDRYRYCDFGGCRKRGERAVETAARELIEETRGIFWGRRDMHALCALLEERAVHENVLCRRQTGNVQYAHFLLPVQFHTARAIQTRFNSCVPRCKAENEKRFFRWFTERELFGAVFAGGYVQPGVRLRSTYLLSIVRFPRFDEFLRAVPFGELVQLPRSYTDAPQPPPALHENEGEGNTSASPRDAPLCSTVPLLSCTSTDTCG